MSFVHLHVHSNFSFKDAAATVEQLVNVSASLGFSALALTDHHTLAGAIRFYRAAKKAKIKPIIGTEIDLDGYGHLVLLAENLEGYRNLCRLLTATLLEHKDSEPVCQWDDLARFSEHLIAFTGCKRTTLYRELMDNHPAEALAWVAKLREIFGPGHLYVELQNHLRPRVDTMVDRLAHLANLAGLPTVVTNNVHYCEQSDFHLRDLLVCMKGNHDINRPSDLRHSSEQYYLKTADEMQQLFHRYPEALVNSQKIADACRLELPLGEYHFPLFPLPEGTSAAQYLTHLCEEALSNAYAEVDRAKADQRLQHELQVIIGMGFAEYFLVVWDLVHFAQKRGIRCSGRGSAGDSLVAYLLGITTVDPIAHNLLFERFLNPERKGMPDIDVDFDSNRRDEILNYVYQRYGEDQVAMICTVNTFSARSAIREVAKAMGFNDYEIDRIAKKMPYMLPSDRIEEALARLPELRSAFRNPQPLKTLFQAAGALDNYPRHLSIHLGGMVIGREPLTDWVPLQWSSKGVIITQYDKDDIEALGLVKMDLLGLKTLSVVEESQAMVRERGIGLDIDHIPLDDPATYELLRSAKTIGVFQVESPGMRELLGRLQPDQFHHLVATVALFRPGPMQGNMIAPYIACRHGEQPAAYLHPDLEPILGETHGVIVYQEQVLEIASRLAGFTLGQADLLRRAMTHDRSPEDMAAIRQQFLDGTGRRGIEPDIANQVFDRLAGFASYGFNKAHAASFGWIAYQTAYLKAHFPAEFLCATLNNQPMGFYPGRIIVDEARRLGVPLLLPSVNHSSALCTVEDGAIRIGLRYVTEMTEAGMASLVAARQAGGPFYSLADLRSRTKLSTPSLLHLIQLGALDELGDRQQLLQELLLSRPVERRKADQAVQLDLFATSAQPQVAVALGKSTVVDPKSQVEQELLLLGLAITAHPLSFYRPILNRSGVLLSGQLPHLTNSAFVRVAGLIVTRQTPPTRSKQRIIFLTMDDEDGLMDCTVFPRVQDRYAGTVMSATALVVEGTLRKTGVNGLSILVQRAYPLADFLVGRRVGMK